MPKVLIVDTDRLVCDIAADDLQDALDASVDCEWTGALGAQALRGEQFDLALIEVELPDMSGFALAKIAADKNTAVLLISGNPKVIEELEAFDWQHIRKPISSQRLFEISSQVLADAAENIRRIKASATRMQIAMATPARGENPG